MKINGSAKNIFILLVVLSVGFGCRFFPSNKLVENPIETPAAAQTVISKESLKERLGRKGVATVPAPGPQDPLRPNPFTLHLRFLTSNKDFKLNQEEYKSLGELIRKLKEIFKDREETGVFKVGTNEYDKTVTLPAYDDYITEYKAKGIYVEDFEKLVDELQKEGITEINLDLNEPNHVVLQKPEIEIDDAVPPPLPSKNLKTISGGVLNGKATELAKPAYPAAAKAVGASGTVNVQVTIDEEGNVVSAAAVSGHPLLRTAAVEAARSSKFAPTMLSGKPVRVTGVIVFTFKPE